MVQCAGAFFLLPFLLGRGQKQNKSIDLPKVPQGSGHGAIIELIIVGGAIMHLIAQLWLRTSPGARARGPAQSGHPSACAAESPATCR